MQKTILITGSTDGIGLQTAKRMVNEGHNIIIHGRNTLKVENVKSELLPLLSDGSVEGFVADLSDMNAVKKLAIDIKRRYKKLDVIINNAGIYKTPNTRTHYGLDVRFVVNTIAPYFLTKELLEVLDIDSRVVNLSSAAQAPVSLEALKGNVRLGDSEAYAQSKLALTMWTNHMSHELQDKVGVFVSINPASFLGSKMVKEAYGMQGKDINIGVDILCRAALNDEFKNANGKYFDNDIGKFSNPHMEALSEQKCYELVKAIKSLIE